MFIAFSNTEVDTMIGNYLKTALANLRKHKVYAFINIMGLSIGMAGSILIFAFISHELSFDRFHAQADNIYRVRTQLKFAGEELDIPKSGPPLGPWLVENFPEVIDSVRFRSMGRFPVSYKDTRSYEDRLFFTDASFFDVFSFPLVRGDPGTALDSPFSVVLAENAARKYFGSEDPLGKFLTINTNRNFKVTGILEDIPANSHLQFDMLCSFSSYTSTNPRDLSNWLSINYYTYLLLEEGASYTELENKLPAVLESNVGALLKYIKGEIAVSLQPLPRIHLHSNLMQEIAPNGSQTTVVLFAVIAVFLLAIGIINFMNLSTARSSSRIQEVGLRKALGASRAQIIAQFLGESVFYSLISLIFALFLVELALPLFGSISGVELSIPYLSSAWTLPLLFCLAGLVGLFAGSYPAFFLSAFHPSRVLKGVFLSGVSKVRFRGALVVLQFVISVSLIIGTIVVFRQLHFMKNTRLGFQKERIVVLPISDESTLDSLRPLKAELLQHTGILSAAASSHVPGQTTFVNPYIPEGFSKSEMQYMGELSVDPDFFPTLGIEMAAGRNFAQDFPTDSQRAAIINESAAQKFGWTDPLGKTIGEINSSGSTIPYTVVGVVRDFHIESLHKPIMPLFITPTTNNFNSLTLLLAPDNISETLSRIGKTLESFDPGRPFEYAFLDDSFDALYRGEERLSRLFSYFAGLAVVIACLGLYGLAAFTAERKSREIGIRKVLGASVSGIVFALSRDFTKWVLAANMAAWPLTYIFMHRWLQGFAYRVSIPLWIFLCGGGLSFLIALLTVSTQAYAAATANPSDSLHYE